MKRTSESSNGKRIFWTVLLIISICVFVVCMFFLIKRLVPKKNTNEEYNYRSDAVSEPGEKLITNPVDFAALKQRNPDICGWIYIPGTEEAYGTAIDYPILQSGEDKEEDFYLTHDLDGKKLFDGSVYIQKFNSADFSNPNTVIYGHDLYNKMMFTPLRKYRNADFFNSHGDMYIYIPGHILTYRIYSAFVYDDRHILNSFNFNSEDGFATFLGETLNPSTMVKNVRSDVSVTTSDKIVTLSTCTNNKSERYLVIGVLTDDQLTK